jgi:hypothetical protein
VVIAIKGGWRDERVRGLLLWAAAIFVPLCVWGNKQAHYLLPLLPPLMILVGWLVDRTLGSDPPAGVVKWVRRVWLGTVVLCLAASPAVIWASSDQRGWITPTDIGLSMSALLLFTGVLLIHHRWGLQAGMVTFGIVVVVAMAAGVGVWAASLEPVTFRSLAQEIRAEFGSDPYAFYKRESLPLCFNLRRVIPVIGTEQELQQSLAEEPRLVVIDIADDDSARALLSEGTVKDKLLGNSKRRMRLYYAIDR